MSGRNRALAGLLTALALVALCITVYLTWSSWNSAAIVGCGADGVVDCDLVLSSHWSRWLGIPVSLFGALVYTIILAICWPAAKCPWGLAGSGLLLLSLSAAGAGIWFITVQAILLQSFCLYCCTVHTCGLVIAAITLVLIQGGEQQADLGQMQALLGVSESVAASEQSSEPISEDRFYPLIASGVAAAGVAMLMVGQIFFAPESLVVEELVESELIESELHSDEPEEAEDLAFELVADDDTDDDADDGEEPETLVGIDDIDLFGESEDASSRRFYFKGLQKSVGISAYPLMGRKDAPHVYVELLDYTCDHCRHLHPYIESTLEEHGDQLAFFIHHVPLNKRCNSHVVHDQPSKRNACEYAQLAIGVWKLAPDKFPEFHSWLMEGEKPPSVLIARRRAISLAGEDVLVDQSLQNEISRRIFEQCEVLNKLKSGLPVLLTEQGAIKGVPRTAQQWSLFIEKQLGKMNDEGSNDGQFIEKGPDDEAANDDQFLEKGPNDE